MVECPFFDSLPCGANSCAYCVSPKFCEDIEVCPDNSDSWCKGAIEFSKDEARKNKNKLFEFKYVHNNGKRNQMVYLIYAIGKNKEEALKEIIKMAAKDSKILPSEILDNEFINEQIIMDHIWEIKEGTKCFQIQGNLV